MECTDIPCEICTLSEWSEWTDCTDKCGGVQKRFRSYFGRGCTNTTVVEDVRQCDDCACTVDGVTYPDNYVFQNPAPNKECEKCKCEKGQIKCKPQCEENKKSCEAKTNEEFIYFYIYPGPNECCGSCNRTTSMFYFPFLHNHYILKSIY